jgi:DNA polymerase III delta subunit
VTTPSRAEQPVSLASRLQVVAGASVRLRDELAAGFISGWQGPVKRAVEPADLNRILLDLETPSFLETATLQVVRGDEKYVKKHQALLTPCIGASAVNGVLLLITPGIDQREKFTKALIQAKALHLVDAPERGAVAGWLAHRLSLLPWGVAHGGAVADALLATIGEDPDALLAAADVAALYAADAPLDVAAVEAVTSGIAERPLWEFTAALLEGRAARAIELLYAGAGIEPQVAISSLLNEVRKLLACAEHSDDAAAISAAGLKGKPNLYYARKRSKEMGRTVLLRVLQGLLQAQRQLRRSGYQPELVMELLALNAQRVVRPAR